MVKKRTILLSIANVVLFVIPFFTGFKLYQYRKIVLNQTSLISFAILLGIMAIVDVVVIVSSFVLKKAPTLIKLVALILIFAFIMYVALTFSGLFVAGNFWKSETGDFSEFSSADKSLNDNLKIAGMTIDDIIALDVTGVDEFHYYYQAYMLYGSFEFKGHFAFSEEDYEILKDKFVDAPEFEIELYSPAEHSSEMTGCFELNTEIPMYESGTTADSWDKIIIEFCDSEKCFYFDLVGAFYT